LILVDTSAWISHLRSSDARLVGMLKENRVVTCDVVIGELELGAGFPKSLLALFESLPRVSSPSSSRTLERLRRKKSAFASSGVGWADAQILIAAEDAGALLHSADRAAKTVWRRLGFRAA
jgi:predicted nucleic acid-binding protein